MALFGVMFGAYTITVQSGEGEVVVESEVDDISVDILRNGEPAKTDWQIKTGADNRWHVRTGKIEVKLPAKLEGEFSVEQDTAKLVRDGKVVVRITRRPKAGAVAAVEKPKQGSSKNRQVAEWVIKHRGQVGIIIQPETPAVGVRAIDDLPAGDFRLWSILIEGAPATRFHEDEFLAQMEHFVGDIRCLWGVPLTDHGLAALARHPAFANIESLSLGGDDRVGPSAVLSIARMIRLRDLNIANTQITTSSLRGLRGLSHFNSLRVSTQQAVDSWDGLLGLSGLRTVFVTDIPGDESLKQLGAVPQLRSVVLLASSEISPQVVTEIERKNPLCRILLRETKVAGRDHQREMAERLDKQGAQLMVEFLPDRVRSEDVSSHDGPVLVKSVTMPDGAEIDDEDLHRLSCLTEISDFHARGLIDADRCAKAFDEQRLLAWHLGLQDADLTDAGLVSLANLPGLGGLNVQRTKVTGLGVDKFRAARPDCKIVWDNPKAGAAADEKVPSNNREVAGWVLKHGGSVSVITTPETPAVHVRTISELPAGDFRFWSVSIQGEPARNLSEDQFLAQLRRIDSDIYGLWIPDVSISDDGLVALTRIPALRHLEAISISGDSAVGPGATLALARMTGLSELNIHATQIPSSSLKGLQGLRRLNRLTIWSQQVDDSWNGLRRLNTLRTLVVTGEPSEEALVQLGDIHQLRSVVLVDSTTTSPQILAEFERKNPLCRILLGGTKVAGRDHQREFAERLTKQGAQLTLAFLPDRNRSEDVDSNEGPVLIIGITMPTGCEIGTDDLQRLSCLTEIGVFNALGLRDADRCAKAFDEQRLLTSYLSLADSDLTDAGLVNLANLPALGTLNVQRTKVTAAGVEKFKAARPDCKIIWEPDRRAE